MISLVVSQSSTHARHQYLFRDQLHSLSDMEEEAGEEGEQEAADQNVCAPVPPGELISVYVYTCME